MSGCPVKHDSTGSLPINSPLTNINVKKEPEYNAAANDLVFDQSKVEGQKALLSTNRDVSNIPKTEFTPDHQPKNSDYWVYPSEQQYYNAMKRKGYNPAEQDVPVILAIHNMVNEQGWSKVREWEHLAGCDEPKLKRFIGRPKDISPKAYFLNLLGYSLPFDRHDWIINRNGQDIRYVIDFYTGHQNKHNTQSLQGVISMHLDVRPAIDSPTAIFERIDYTIRQWFFPHSLKPYTNHTPYAKSTYHDHIAHHMNTINSNNNSNINTNSTNSASAMNNLKDCGCPKH